MVLFLEFDQFSILVTQYQIWVARAQSYYLAESDESNSPRLSAQDGRALALTLALAHVHFAELRRF